MEHFLHNEVYQSKVYQNWLTNFHQYGLIDENEEDNWYMIWLTKHLEELQVYCEEEEEDQQ